MFVFSYPIDEGGAQLCCAQLIVALEPLRADAAPCFSRLAIPSLRSLRPPLISTIRRQANESCLSFFCIKCLLRGCRTRASSKQSSELFAAMTEVLSKASHQTSTCALRNTRATPLISTKTMRRTQPSVRFFLTLLMKGEHNSVVRN